MDEDDRSETAPVVHTFAKVTDLFERASSLTHPEHRTCMPVRLPNARTLRSHQLSFYEPLAESDDEEDVKRRSSSFHQVCRLLLLAGPLLLEGISGMAMSLITTTFIGHDGKDPTTLSGLVLGSSLYSVMGYSLVSGLASAMETLCGQAYGAGSYPRLGVILQRSRLLCVAICLPTCLMWATGAMGFVLPGLGQPLDVAVASARYLQLMWPALLLSVWAETAAQYLLAQGVAAPACFSNLACLLLCPLVNWLTIKRMGWGLDGAAYAQVLLQLLLVLFLNGYRVYRDHVPMHPSKTPDATWHGWTLSCFDGWGEYLSFGAPAVAFVCLQWWGWEVIVLLAGLLDNGEVAVAAMGLATQLYYMTWMVSYALGGAATTLVAIALGGRRPEEGKHLFRLTCLMAMVGNLTMSSLMLLFGPSVAAGLTSSEAVQELMVKCIPMVVAAMVGDGQVASVNALLRACGRQGLGAIISVICYWCVGLPVGCLLGFYAGWGVVGLWAAPAVSVLLQVVVLHLIAAFKLDWKKECDRAVTMAQQEDGASWLHGVEAGECE